MSAVAAVLLRAAELLSQQQNQDARRIAELDRQIMALAPRVTKLGHAAVPELAAASLDKSKPPKLRLFAVSFLGLTREPQALPPLSRVAADKQQPSYVRVSAVSSLANLPVSAEARRGALCKALDVREARREVSTLGCETPTPLEEHARRGDLDAIAALGRTPPLDAVRLLLELIGRRPLVRRFAADSAQSAAVLRALGRRIEDLRALGPKAPRPIVDTVRHGQLNPAVALAGVPLLAELRPDGGTELLIDLLDNRDASVVVAAAEALGKLRHEAALPKLRALVEGALQDPRFGPRKDAAALLVRLEDAERTLKSP